MAALTIAGLVPASIDERVRAWLKGQVRGQQSALGERLERAGVVKNGQVWVSRYTRGDQAVLTLDHLMVIAGFFERTIPEVLAEAGVTGAVTGADQGSVNAERIRDLEARNAQLANTLAQLQSDLALVTRTLTTVGMRAVESGVDLTKPKPAAKGRRRAG